MRKFLFIKIILLISVLSSNVVLAQKTEKRVALIWGNAHYPDKRWGDLPVCEEDANAIDKKLKEIGFTPIKAVDLTREEMSKSLKNFSKLAKDADIVLFYYSGHGTFLDNEYYFVPAKSDFGEKIISSDYFPEEDLLNMMRDNRLSLLFYDACRDFTPATNYQNQGAGKGIKTQTPKIGKYFNETRPYGTPRYIAAPKGKKASTGSTGSLSPFTQVLCEYITYAGDFQSIWVNFIKGKYKELTNIEPECIDPYINKLELNPSGHQPETPGVIPVSASQKEITITTDAPNATIVINGKEFKPGSPLLYTVGETYVYSITAEGYMPEAGKLVVNEETPTTTHITMKKATKAFLSLTSNVEANVSFDKKYVGKTPITFESTYGYHSLELSSNGYYTQSLDVKLNEGLNTKQIHLTKRTPWLWDWDDDEVRGFLGYSFSPKYQIGINGFYHFEDTRFSLGGYIALSTGAFRKAKIKADAYAKVSTDTYSSGVDDNGKEYSYWHRKTVYSGIPENYSPEIDPYNEAKNYDSNFLVLVNSGFNLCNGVMLEAGLGAASHRKKIYMPHNYKITKTVTTDLSSGNVIGEPTYEIEQVGGSTWYTSKVKWSPALRLGARTFVPIGIDWYLTLGGGYTYLFTNNKISSWDASLGFAWSF